MFENAGRTELENLGEFGLIDHLASHFAPGLSDTIQGIGDDAAVFDMGDKYGLVSSDLMLEGIHFDLTFHPIKHLGYKAVVSNLSDICAMNGIPKRILINIGLSNRFSLEAVEEFYAGVKLACEKYNVDLVGGDTSASPRGLMLSVTALGEVAKDKITWRRGVKAHDLLVVSGDLGGAYMGLQILEREKKVFLEHPEMQPDLEPHDYIVGRQLKPECRTDIVDMLEALQIVPSSMIDVSDGVASEIHHLGKNSGLGFDIYEEKLPIDPQTLDRAIEFGLNPSIVALNGGEDFELLFTTAASNFDKIKNNPDLSIIGHATEMPGKYRLVTQAGNAFDIKAQGWEKPNN